MTEIEVCYPSGVGYAWRPFPHTWAGLPSDSETAWDRLSDWRRDHDRPFVPITRRMYPWTRWFDGLTVGQVRDRMARDAARWRYSRRRIPGWHGSALVDQGPTFRHRWPDPKVPRLIDKSSDDRAFLRTSAGSGRLPKHDPKPLAGRPESEDAEGWQRLADRLGDCFDDIESEGQERYRTDHEVQPTSDYTFDLPEVERSHGIERSRARHERSVIARMRETRDDERDPMARGVGPVPILGSWINTKDPFMPEDPPKGMVRPYLFPLGWALVRLPEAGDRTREDDTSAHLTGSDTEASAHAAKCGVLVGPCWAECHWPWGNIAPHSRVAELSAKGGGT